MEGPYAHTPEQTALGCQKPAFKQVQLVIALYGIPQFSQRQLKRFITLAASFLIIKFLEFLFLLFAFNSLTILGCNCITIAKLQVYLFFLSLIS